MRVLFTTTGHSGHLLPLAPLAHACAGAGHEVEIVTHAPRAAAVEAQGLPVIAVEPLPDEAWAPMFARIPGLPQSEADALFLADGFAAIGAGGVLDAVTAVVGDRRPDLLVHEGYEYAGPLAAERHGVPRARMALGLVSTEDWADRLAAPGVAGLRERLGLPAQPPPRGPLLSTLPPGLDDGEAERFRPADPVAAPAPLPDWWPGRDGPLVYLTFGSVTGSLRFWPALYRAVLDVLAPLPVRVLVTVGRDPDLAALGEPPANAHVEAWVPQDDVLAAAAAVIAHGGHGTTLGALRAGVPSVLVPLFAGDQWRTADRLAAVGAGIVVRDGDPDAFASPSDDEIARLPEALDRVLGEPAFAEAARRLGAELAALPPAAAATAVLERLAA